jgi:hypothetical protein
LATYHATALPKPAKKFHILHQRHFWKTTNVNERSSATENPVVTTSHSQQDAGVMRKGIRQSINRGSRQANPKIAATDLWIIHDALDLIQTLPRDFGINVQEPKDLAARGAAASIHLYCSIALVHDKLIAKTPSEIGRAIRAFTICDNNLCSWRSFAQLVKKWPYQRCLIKDRNNDRELRSMLFHQIACQELSQE